MISRRTFVSASLLAGAGQAPSLAQAITATAGTSSPAGADRQLMLAINEAATATVSIAALYDRYEPMAKILSKISPSPVRPEPFIDVGLFRAELAKQPRPAYIFNKTVDLLAEEVVAGRYLPLVRTADPYVAGFVASPNFHGDGLASLKGQLVLFPPPDTMTARLGFKALRQLGLGYQISDSNTPQRLPNSVVIRHVPKNDVIDSIIGNPDLSWFSAGLMNPSALKGWKGRVLAKLDPQPNWSLAARADLPGSVVASAIEVLSTLHQSADGQKALEAMKVRQFVPAKKSDYINLLDYLR